MASLICLRRASSCYPWMHQHQQLAGRRVHSITLRSSSVSRLRNISRRPPQLNNAHHRSPLIRRRSTAARLPAPPAAAMLLIEYCPLPFLLLFHNQHFYHRSSVQRNTYADGASRLLATTTALASDEDRNTLLQRIAQWLWGVWRRCQDVVFMVTRGSEIIVRLSPLIILTPASMLVANWYSYCDDYCERSQTNDTNKSDDTANNNNNNPIADWTWCYTRYSITALGPAFVKLFQWVATRRDIFSPAVCDRLSVLHDRGQQHAWHHTAAALEAAFGRDYQCRGLLLDRDSPVIGCGSAAQVYRGTLLVRQQLSSTELDDNGVVQLQHRHPVAVKVLHPRMGERVKRDLHFVQTVADWLHGLPFDSIKMLNLPRAVQNFGAILLRQADLQIEADNLIQFRKNFYRNKDEEKASAILFPRPMEGWISKTVLVEDLVNDATPISEYLKDSTERGIQLRKELASPLLRAFLKMVFLDNFVHCDLHAGNVLIQTSTVERKPSAWNAFWRSTATGNNRNHNNNEQSDEGKETKRQIVFLDAGIATSLNPNDQRNLRDLFRAVILNEGNQAGRLMVERAQYERCSEIPGGVDAFASGIEDLVSEFHIRRKEGLTLGAVRIGSLLSRVLDLCRVYGVEIDPSMSSIVISTLVLEGLGRSLEPELNLIDFAVPFVLGRGRV